MADNLPRIDKVTVSVGYVVLVKFKGKAGSEKVDLGGWIVTGGPTLAPLRKRECFLLAEIINWALRCRGIRARAICRLMRSI